MHHGFTLRSPLTILLFCLFVIPTGLFAQRPGGIGNLEKLPANWSTESLKMDCSEAGEIDQFSGFQMQSTSFGDNLPVTATRPYGARPDTIFLCAQDQFTVSLDNSTVDLGGDPNTATTPGVGYAFYRCDPTVTGPTLADVVADPCVADNGLSPFDELAVAIPLNYATGDYTLTVANDGTGNNTIPALFPVMGMPSPVVLTLAPITFDDVDANGEAFYEGNPIGECVDVSIDQSFTVAYLNPVTVANLGVNPTEPCEGLFDVRGGTPELLGGTGYDIIIEEVTSGARAVITTPAADIVHNAVVQYTVPQPGQYRITILDQNSCPLEETLITHSAGCPLPVVISHPFATGLTGTNVCVPITVDNFNDIVAVQFGTLFDPAVLQFTGITNINGALTGSLQVNGPPSFPGGTLNDGEIRVTYNDNFTGPTTLPTGALLFEMCFDIFGAFGTQSPLTCQSGGVGSIPPVFTRDGNGSEEAATCNDGAFSVTDQNFLLELTGQAEACEGQDNGRVIATASGAAGPFVFSVRRLLPLPATAFGDEPDITIPDNPATAEFSGREPGTYQIRAVAANGEEVISDVEVDDAPQLGVNIRAVSPPSCNGFSDGVVVAEVSLGGSLITDPIAQGYTFAWEGFSETTDTLRDIIGGSYEVTVTSPNGCVASDPGGFLTQPGAVSINTVGVVDASCNGAEDGSISVNATGGTGPYDFNWQSPFITNEDDVTAAAATMLPAGPYELIVTDSRDCSDTLTFIVDTVKVLGIVAVVDSVSCFGDADGVISVNGTATGAFPTGNYFVTLNNLTTATVGTEMEIVNNSVPFPFAGLDVGTYEVILRDEDAAGCEVRDTFEIFQPDLLEIEPLTITNETCITGMDGTVTVPVTGGTMPYSYRIVNDSLDTPLDTTLAMGNLLTGLSADTNYVVIVTDRNGCVDSLDFRINAPAGATLSMIDTSFISCPGDVDGRLTVVATPPQGETITRFEWRRVNPDGTLGAIVASGPNASSTEANLPVGQYVVTVTTSNACTAQALGVVNSPGEVFLESFTQNDPQCPGDANGSIFINPGGGTPNADGTYNYVISTPDDPFGTPTTNPAFTNLTAGSYTITIEDGNGCTPLFDTTFVLVDPPAITGTFAITNVSCPDDMTADGSATFTAEYSDGTQGTFDFLWTSGTADFATNTSTENGLTRGPVTVNVTDGVCTMSFTDTIRSPEEFVVDLQTSDVSCNGLDDGSATVVVTGGTAGYDYAWSNSTDNAASITDLAAGTGFTLNITDANGCAVPQETFLIREPDPLTLSIDPVATTETVRCAGDANGRISVFVSSVNNNDLSDAPYAWSGNVGDPTSPVATDLTPGTYSVTVTDVEGCQDSLSYTIGEPEAITFSVLPIEEPLCFGETTPVLIDTAFGGTSTGINNFTFSVNNDGFRIPVGQTGTAFAGEVVVTVFDSVGCSASQTFSVNQPPQIIIDLPESIVVELGDSLTRLNPLISPAGDVYQYLWTPADFLSSDTVRNPLLIRPEQDTDYTFRVTNANGCQAFADIFVEVDANRNVYIPNVFSPNRDGRNEDFRIFACQGVQRVSSVQVFDRWGGLLFSKDNLEPNCLDGIKLWDGSGQNGKPVNPGVFVYVIEVEFLDRVKLVYRGDVTVLR